MNHNISNENLVQFSSNFSRSKANKIAMHAVSKNGIHNAAENVYAGAINQHAFSITVESGKATNQKMSGRCWMFASLNVMRLEVMNKLNIENLELSQTYPLFFDKLEKSNYFLENILETLDEPTDGRMINFLLQSPVGDGGQWDMFRSIVAKYGVVPKDVYPETAVSENTTELRTYITKKLREYAYVLRSAYQSGKTLDELRAMKDDMLNTIYRFLAISLGEPPKTFTWETYDKDKKFIRIENITPLAFFNEYVGWDLENYVTVIDAPTVDKPYHKTYTVQYLGSVHGGAYPVKYLNLPIEELKALTIAQLKNGECVWFGCDVGQFSNRNAGHLTLDAYDVQTLLDTDFTLTKAQRLDYGESLMTHAMVITGVDLDSAGKPIRWKVENSWGEDRGNKGYYVMSDDWFSEYTYQILLHRKYFSEEQNKNFDTEPVVLKPWDPMGSLA